MVIILELPVILRLNWPFSFQTLVYHICSSSSTGFCLSKLITCPLFFCWLHFMLLCAFPLWIQLNHLIFLSQFFIILLCTSSLLYFQSFKLPFPFHPFLSSSSHYSMCINQPLHHVAYLIIRINQMKMYKNWYLQD